MDGWKYEIKQDGWWLAKMKTVLKNQTYNNSKTFIRYNDKSRVVTKQKKNKWNRLRDTETGEHLEKKT